MRTLKTHINKFVQALGWPEPVEYIKEPPIEVSPEPIVWYESVVAYSATLQVNVSPSPHACVFAMRYRICTGWHPIMLEGEPLRKRVSAVASFLALRWYETSEMRKVFRKLHPECRNYTWDRLQKDGPPYNCND